MGLKVKSRIKAGFIASNHTRAGLRVKSGVRAGYGGMNHIRAVLAA